MAGKMRIKDRQDRGTTLVEMALVTVFILVPLLAGITDLGRAFYTYVAITNAAREGARFGSRMPCYSSDTDQQADLQSEIINAVRNEASNYAINLTAADITITPDPVSTGCVGWTGGAELRVRVNLDFDTILAGVIGTATINLDSQTGMVIFGNN